VNKRKSTKEKGDVIGPLLITVMILVLIAITLPK
jgi:hypothetical protein